MPRAISHTVEQFLRPFTRVNQANDEALLDRFVSSRDGDAFAEIVRRHGPMVFGVAIRRLHHADAEDVFQTVFLHLARQASSVRGGALGAWLHRVAVRVAAKRRPTAAVEITDVANDRADPFADAAWREIRGLLDDELNKLPNVLRAPLVLCYLEANTRDEAAAHLGWSLRTVERRLQQARALLQQRLRRRGIASAALAAGCLSPTGLLADVSVALRQSTVVAAIAQPVVSAFSRTTSAMASVLFNPSAKTIAAVTFAMAAVVSTYFFAIDSAAEAPKRVSARDDCSEMAGMASPDEPVQNADEPPDVPLPDGAVKRFGSMAWRHNGSICEAVLSKDGKTLVTRGQQTIAVWETETGRRKLYLRNCGLPQYFEPGTVAAAPDGKWVAALGGTGTEVQVWDVDKGLLLWAQTAKKPEPKQRAAGQFPALGRCRLALSPDGEELLFCDQQDVRVHDARTGAEIRRIKLPGRVVAMSPDGQVLATHTFPQSYLVLCDARSGKEIARTAGSLVGKEDSFVSAIRVSFSPDGKFIATNANYIREVRVWHRATGKLFKTLERPIGKDVLDDDRLACIAFAHDGKTLLAGGFVYSGVRRWDVATGKESTAFMGSRNTVTALLPMPDDKTLLTCGGDCTIRRWDLHTGIEAPQPRRSFANHATAILSPDGKTVVTTDASNRLEIWEANTGEWIANVVLTGEYAGRPAAFSADGKILAAAQRDGPLAMIDTTTWKVKDRVFLRGQQTDLKSVLFVNGDQQLLCNGSGNWMLYDLIGKKMLWEIAEYSNGLALHPAGKMFASATASSEGDSPTGLSIRRLADGKELLAIPVQRNPKSGTVYPIRIDSLAFSPDGKSLAATRWDDGDVYVWDALSGAPIWCLKGHEEPTSFAPRIGDSVVTYSPEGRWIASGHNDGTIRIWEMASGQEVRRFVGHDAQVTSLAFAPNGRTLLSAAGVEVLQWHVPTKPDAKAEASKLWDCVASEQGADAYRAMWSLAGQGRRGIDLLRAKITPAPRVEGPNAAQLIADLDSPRFGVRDKASKDLASRGSAVEKELVEARAKHPTPEAANRIDELLRRIHLPPRGTELQMLRGIQVIEWIGGDHAKRLLQQLGDGEPGARVTIEARRSLSRLQIADGVRGATPPRK